MDSNKLLQAVIDMVPSWYQADCGSIPHVLSVDGVSETFYTERGLTPNLSAFLSNVEAELEALIATTEKFPESMVIEILQETLAESWLTQHNSIIDWSKLFSYNRELDNRTYENAPVSLNILIRKGPGDFDLTDKAHNKLIDPLARDVNVYFEVNENLCYRSYNSVSWSEVNDSESYKFLPEFLHPFQQIKRQEDWSAHKTSRGDLIIMDFDGLRATRRKGRWTIYDPPTIKNMIVDLLGGTGNYWVACNLFELLLDLSYKRHGALLIYDEDGRIDQYVTNKESLLSSDNDLIDPVRAGMREAIQSISFSSGDSRKLKKRLLIEMASMDGAVIYSRHNLKGFGSMIQAHPSVGEASGARTTAAISSYLYRCFSVKISSDGDITIYFTSENNEGTKAAAKLSFL